MSRTDATPSKVASAELVRFKRARFEKKNFWPSSFLKTLLKTKIQKNQLRVGVGRSGTGELTIPRPLTIPCSLREREEEEEVRVG
jgi:hypothetical protein